MNANPKWIRVGKQNPCPVCKKPDWCSVCPDINLVLCMRVQSEKPSKNKMGGWIHSIGEKRIYYRPAVKPQPPQESIDFEALWKTWKNQTSPEDVQAFAESLFVESSALEILGAAWSAIHRAWAFPMWDSIGKVIGIRLRSNDGSKFAVRGSHVGIFKPIQKCLGKTLYVCEGPTDTAAALTINLHSIGRPSCMGCEQDVADYISQNGITRCVIVADNDDPGQRGASRLQDALRVPSCIITPPAKDIREFVELGGDYETIQSLIKSVCWTMKKNNL